MVEFLQFTLSGISFGMIYAAIALSLVLIWRGTRLLNFAQGGMAMFTTYIALEVIRHTGSYWAGFVIALAAGVVLGAAAELAVVRPALGKPELNAVIITIVLVEQNARAALAIADRGVVLNLGRVVAAADARTLATDVALRHHYLGFLAGAAQEDRAT